MEQTEEWYWMLVEIQNPTSIPNLMVSKSINLVLRVDYIRNYCKTTAKNDWLMVPKSKTDVVEES